jgi:hypothetical protein
MTDAEFYEKFKD